MGPDSQVLYYGGDGDFQLLCLKIVLTRLLLPDAAWSPGIADWLGPPFCLAVPCLVSPTGWPGSLHPGGFPTELHRRVVLGALQLSHCSPCGLGSLSAGRSFSPWLKKDH